MSPRPSLSRRVPVFLAALLAVVLGTAAVVGYMQLERLLLRENQQRLQGATGLVAQILSDQLAPGTEQLGARADSVVGRILDEAALPGAEADAMLRGVIMPDEGRAVWLVDTTGTCVAAAGIESGGAQAPGCADVGGESWSEQGPDFGPITRVGSEARYRVVVPVRTPGWTGHAIFEQAFASPDGGTLISALVSPDAQLLIGNATGGVWTDLGAPVAYDIPTDRPRRIMRFDAGGDERIAAMSAIPGTPWVVLIHRAADVVLGPARTFLAWIGGAGLLILLFSSGIAWMLSLRLTRPLASLADGAEAIADGRYDRRVEIDRGDEIGRLGDAFNTMADEVDRNRRALEARVAERTRSLQAAVASLEEAQEALVRKERLATIGQLAGSVGHELRNPLGVMTNALFYLDAINGDASPKVKEYMGILGDQVRAAEKIVSDLLDFARVKSPDRGPVPVRAVVDDVLASMHVPAGIFVEIDVPDDTPAFLADRAHVVQILQNLTTNAVQAMGQGGSLTLSAASANGSVSLSVTDTGVGIEPDELARVFEPLVTSKARGIGLGLAVSRSLAEANHGSLTARSEPGVGSTFALSLPVADALGVA